MRLKEIKKLITYVALRRQSSKQKEQTHRFGRFQWETEVLSALNIRSGD